MPNVFVLTSVEGKEERPVAVVDNEKMAEDWVKQNKSNNWIPFEMNDLSLASHEKQFTPFQSKPEPPAVTEQRKREELQKQHSDTEAIRQNIERIQRAQEEMRKHTQPRTSALLRSAADMDDGSIEDQVADLMMRRCFSEGQRGADWATYSRNEDDPDGGVYLKVFFKDGQVSKTDMFDKEPENVIETRVGWAGLRSYTNTFGD